MFPGWRSRSLALACALVGALALPPLAPANVKPDPGFGGDGSLVTKLPLAVTDAALDREGRIVIGGVRFGQPSVVRLLPDGTPDPTFGGDGEVHEGSVNGTLDVKVEVLPDGSVRALVHINDGEGRYLRVDFGATGDQTGAVYFPGSSGSADLTEGGGAIASFVDGEIVARRYGFVGEEDPTFRPETERATLCNPPGGRCTFFAPTELGVNSAGTVVRSIKNVDPLHSCDGTERVSALPPGEIAFGSTETYAGCGISEVFSIETDPKERFLVSGWNGPPSQPQFVRYRKRGGLAKGFGQRGVATGPTLATDNLFLPDPAFSPKGSFFTSFTHPRTPTLSLSPVRFGSSGDFKKRFATKAKDVTFDIHDAISDFDPAVTLRTESGRILIVGTGQTGAGPVPAVARWR